MSIPIRTEALVLPPAKAPVEGHPAKIHPELAKILVQEYSESNILDPMAGVGTILWAAREIGRHFSGFEIEPEFVKTANAAGLPVQLGDARDMPLKTGSVETIITSPPYGEAIGRSGDRNPRKTAQAKQKYEMRRFGKAKSGHVSYGTSPGNVGALPLSRKSAPCFTSEFPIILREMHRVLAPEGLAVLVVKDQRLGRRSLGLFDLQGWLVQTAQEIGFIFHERRVAIIPENNWTLWMRVNEKRWDNPIPNVEYIIVLRRRRK